MDTSQSRRKENGSVFRYHRVLSHPPQRVFEAFAKPELLARWWGPDGFTNTFEVFEFRVGGRWKFVMHGPNGSHPNESVFLELKAPSAVVIHHVSQPRYVLRVTLATCEPANEQNLNRPQAVLAGGGS